MLRLPAALPRWPQRLGPAARGAGGTECIVAGALHRRRWPGPSPLPPLLSWPPPPAAPRPGAGGGRGPASRAYPDPADDGGSQQPSPSTSVGGDAAQPRQPGAGKKRRRWFAPGRPGPVTVAAEDAGPSAAPPRQGPIGASAPASRSPGPAAAGPATPAGAAGGAFGDAGAEEEGDDGGKPTAAERQAIQSSVERAAKMLSDVLEEVARELFVSEATAYVRGGDADVTQADAVSRRGAAGLDLPGSEADLPDLCAGCRLVDARQGVDAVCTCTAARAGTALLRTRGPITDTTCRPPRAPTADVFVLLPCFPGAPCSGAAHRVPGQQLPGHAGRLRTGRRGQGRRRPGGAAPRHPGRGPGTGGGPHWLLGGDGVAGAGWEAPPIHFFLHPRRVMQSTHMHWPHLDLVQH